ncbi:MAG: transposase [Chromatiaceae bacterium]
MSPDGRVASMQGPIGDDGNGSAHRLKTRAGRAAYALRKQTVEPVFGIIKSVMGFRQFLTRGLQNVQGEWTLVCLAWNLKRMAVLRP